MSDMSVMDLESIRLEGGLRTGASLSRPFLEKPVVTVVTVVRNDREHLDETIRSVLSQSYGNIEYILIDGGSTDGTLDVIREYDDRIDYWLSEPDKGIYDAMNKGIDLATGEWINFMNSGDRFHDNGVVERIFARDQSGYDLVYGNSEVSYGGRFSRIQKAGSIDNLWQGMNFSHQGSFIRTSVLKGKRFNQDNPIGADFEMIYQLLRDGGRFNHVDETLDTVEAGGVSDLRRVRTVISHWKTVSHHDDSFKVRLFFLLKIADAVLRSIAKKLLPKGIVDRMIRGK